MRLLAYNYALLLLICKVFSIRLSFVHNLKRFNLPSDGYGLKRSKNDCLGSNLAVKAVNRNGVCVPEDVGLYGRMIVSYECLYTKDGRTQTGDEWEAEMTAETKANFPGVSKRKIKCNKIGLHDDEPDCGFVRLDIPAPFNPTKMLLREGIPYLRLSCWAPGIKMEDFKVFINYTSGQEYPESYEDSADLPNSPELNKYYETCESMPVTPQHKYSYNSTYNDLFNLMPKAKDGFADLTPDVHKAPLILINFPKNTLVNQWERMTFSKKRDPETRKKLSRVQRAYRPFSHVDLRNVSCVYSEGTLQLLLKLTHIVPPPEFQKNYKLAVTTGEVKPPKTLPLETVHGWMYNWHYFPKYDLDFDISKFPLPEPTEENKPHFVDDMTPRMVRKFMKEAEEMEKRE